MKKMKIVNIKPKEANKKIDEPKKPFTLGDIFFYVVIASLVIVSIVTIVAMVLIPDEKGGFDQITFEVIILAMFTGIIALGIMISTRLILKLLDSLLDKKNIGDKLGKIVLVLSGLIVLSTGYIFIFPFFPLLQDPFNFKSISGIFSDLYGILWYFSFSFVVSAMIFIYLDSNNS